MCGGGARTRRAGGGGWCGRRAGRECRGAPGPGVRPPRRTRVPRPGLGAHWGRAWLQGLCPFSLGPQLSAFKVIRKRLESKRRGRGRAGSRLRAGGGGLGRRVGRSVLAAPVDGLARRLRRLLRLLGALLLRELFARGNGVLLGPPLGLGGRLQAAALQHLRVGWPHGGERGRGSGTPRPVPRHGLPGTTRPSEAAPSPGKWRPSERCWGKQPEGRA